MVVVFDILQHFTAMIVVIKPTFFLFHSTALTTVNTATGVAARRGTVRACVAAFTMTVPVVIANLRRREKCDLRPCYTQL